MLVRQYYINDKKCDTGNVRREFIFYSIQFFLNMCVCVFAIVGKGVCLDLRRKIYLLKRLHL